MATDTKLLLSGLEAYLESVNRHIESLKEEYQHLDNTWRRFSACYEGEAADQFREGWLRTADRFREYMEGADRIRIILDERVDALREANRTEGVLG